MKKKSFLTLSLLAIFTLLSGVIFMPQNKSTVNADAVTATYDYSINKYNYHWQYDSEQNLWSTDNIYDMDSDDNLAYYLNMTVQTGGTINLVFDFRLSTLNKGGELTAYINETNIIPNIEAKNKEQQQVTYSGVVSTGDVISINYVRPSGTGYDYDHNYRYGSYEKYNKCQISGLPFALNNERSLNVTTQEGGSVAINDNAFSEEDNFTGTSDDVVLAKVNVEEGYCFAGWLDLNTNKIYSKLTSVEVSLKMSRKLQATFVKETEIDLTPVFIPKDEKVTWDSDKLTATFTAETSFSYEMTYIGEKTLSFDIAPEAGGYLYIYVDGEQVYNNYCSATFGLEDEAKANFMTMKVPLEGNSIHKVRIENEVTYLSSYYLKKLIIKNFQVLDGIQYTMINVQLDDRLGYIEYDGKIYHNGESIKVFNSFITKYVWRVPYSSITSTIDDSKNTYVKLANLTIVDGEYTYPKDYVSDGRYDSGKDAAKKYTFYNETVLYKIDFQEVAVQPNEIIVEKYVENNLIEQKTTRHRDIIELPFGKSNMIAVKISDYSNVSETTKVWVNDVLTDIEFAVGFNGFILEDISVDTTVKIVNTLDNYSDSDDFYIYLKMTTNATIDELKLTDNITLTNDDTTYLVGDIEQKNEWVFAPEYSTTDNYVFKPGNAKAYKKADGNNDWEAVASSNLKITLTGSGVLSFYAKYGSNSYSNTNALYMGVLYNIGEKITLNKVNYSYYASGGTKLWYNNDYVATSMITEAEDGWYLVQIPINAETNDTVSDLYLAYLKSTYDDHSFYIKDMAFLQGTATTSFSVLNGVGGQVKVDATIQNGENKENITETKINGLVNNIVKGSTTTFTAIADEGYKFFAFVDKDNNVLSYNTTYTINQVNDYEIKAVFLNNSDVARIGFNTYASLKDAVNSAKAGDVIYLINDTTLTESLIIPNGVSLVMPIEVDGTYFAIGTALTAQATASFNNPEKYLLNTLTIDSGVTLTIDGELIIGAVQHYPDQFAQGITSGKYNQIINNGTILVGGTLKVYGLIDGTGKIELNNGATLYEPYIVNNFSGGTDTEGLYSAEQFPFEQFDTINIRLELKVNFGAKVIGMTSLYFWGSVHTQDVDLVGTQEGLIQLTQENSYLVSTYNKDKFLKNGSRIDLSDSGKRTLHIYGGAIAGNFSIQGYGSKGMYLAIPYTYDIYLDDGVYEIPEGYGYKVMPGANLIVERNATLNVNGKLLVYNTFKSSDMDGKIYPSIQNLTDYGFDINGVFVVNGTLNINGTFAGHIQSYVLGAKVNIAEGATLKVDVVNGAKTSYDCNIVKFTLKTFVFIANHYFYEVEAGKSYVVISEESCGTSTGDISYAVNTTKDEADNTLTTKLGETIRYHKMVTEDLTDFSFTIRGCFVEVHEHKYIANTPTYATEEHNGVVTYRCENLSCAEYYDVTLIYLPTLIGEYTYTGDVLDVQFKNFNNEVMEIINPQEIKNAGQYQIKIALKDSKNYAWSRESLDSEILTFNLLVNSKALENISFENKTVTYDGQAQGLIVTGAPTDATITYECENGKNGEIVNAGEYEITVVISGENYVTIQLNATLTILTRDVTIAIDNKTGIYGETLKELTYKEPQNKIAGDNLQVVLTKQEGNEPGDYQITGECLNQNYNATFVNGIYTIDKITSQIATFNVVGGLGTIKNGNIIEVVYTGSEFNVIGAVQDDRVVNVMYLTLGARINVGEYSVKLTADENAHYKKAEIIVTLKIVKKYFEYNFTDKQVNYTGIPKNAGEFVPMEFTKNYDLQIKYNNQIVDEITQAGTYQITITLDEQNYYGTYTFNVTVNKIAVDFDLTLIKNQMIVKANSITLANCENIEYSINNVTYYSGEKVFDNLNALQTYTIYVKHLGDDNHNDTIKTFKQKTTRLAQDVNNLIDNLPEKMNVSKATYDLFKQISSIMQEVSTYEQDQINKTKLNEKIAEYNQLVTKVNEIASEAKEASQSAFNIVLTLTALATAVGAVVLINKRKLLG